MKLGFIKSIWKLWLAIAIISLVLLASFKIVRVTGKSMEPTFYDGSFVLATRLVWLFPIKKGDVVVVHLEDEEIIKRVSYIDGDRVFLLGDNLDNSEDSRSFGTVPISAVDGSVFEN